MSKKDNSTLKQKIIIRKKALSLLENPVVMETHGGEGVIYKHCYSEIEQGVVFEKDSKKTWVLGAQRPHWAVYEINCIDAIRNGAAAHIPINFVDLDPYGAPWDVVDAFFGGPQLRVKNLVFVVNDGMRLKLNRGGGWDVAQLKVAALKYGSALRDRYLDACRDLMIEKSALAGYKLEHFSGYYTGHAKQMTHYLALFNCVEGCT